MLEIRCPHCGGLLCRAENPPVECKCNSCHKVALYDGTGATSSARPMAQEEILRIKGQYHTGRKARKANHIH